MRILTNLSELNKHVLPIYYISVIVDGAQEIRNKKASEFDEDISSEIDELFPDGSIFNITLRRPNGTKPSGAPKFANVGEFQFIRRSANFKKPGAPVHLGNPEYRPDFNKTPLGSSTSVEASNLYHTNEVQRLQHQVALLENRLQHSEENCERYKSSDWEKEKRIQKLEIEKESSDSWKELAPHLLQQAPALLGMLKGGGMPPALNAAGDLSPARAQLLSELANFDDEAIQGITDFVRRLDTDEKFAQAYQELVQKHPLRKAM